jgi:hypothetical protein
MIVAEPDFEHDLKIEVETQSCMSVTESLEKLSGERDAPFGRSMWQAPVDSGCDGPDPAPGPGKTSPRTVVLFNGFGSQDWF